MVIGYITLLLACFCGMCKALFGKKMSGFVKAPADAMFANGIRMVLCVVIGFVLAVATDGIGAIIPSTNTLLIAALSAVSNATMLICWVLAVRTGALVLLDVFLLIGSSLPLILSYFAFGDPIYPVQYLGLAIMLVALIVMCTYNNSIKTKLTPKAIILLLVCGFTNGAVSFTQKWFKNTEKNGSIAVFNLWAFLFASIIIFIALYVVMLKNKGEVTKGVAQKHKLVSLKNIYIYVIIMAVALFVNNYAITVAASKLDAVLIFPTQNAINIVLTTIMANIAFKERMNIKGIIGIILAFISIFVTNVLPTFIY